MKYEISNCATEDFPYVGMRIDSSTGLLWYPVYFRTQADAERFFAGEEFGEYVVIGKRRCARDLRS